jgi:hypothetical protein
MKDSLNRVIRAARRRHPAVLTGAALALIGLATAAVPSARAVARHLITGRDIADGSVTAVDLRNGAINSHKILDGHVLSRDLSAGLRRAIARHSVDGRDGRDGRDGQSVTGTVIPVGDARCASRAGGVAYTLGGSTTAVCNGKDGQAGSDATAGSDVTTSLTDVGNGWDSHASATRDPDGWVHLSGYLTCTGPTGCADQAVSLPAGFASSSAKEVMQLMTEMDFGGSSSYDQNAGAVVLQGSDLLIPDASTGSLNSLNVWLSGITYKAASAG